MNEQTRPLEIALMGYDRGLAIRHLADFARDNAEQVVQRLQTRVKLRDHTTITAIYPDRVRAHLDGHHYDQLILADDEREMIRETYAEEIEIVKAIYMGASCVPEAFQVLYYNPFAPEPCNKCGLPSEVLHYTATERGAVTLCHTCHEREHTAGRTTALTVKISVEGLDEVTKKFAALGTTIAEASEAFHKMAEAAKEAIPLEEEIALIRANPSLSRFQKWSLIRKIRKGRRA